MAYKQNPGRGPMMKTGKGVPSALLQENPTDPVKKKTDEKSGEKPSYPGETWKRPDFTTKKGSYSRLQESAAIKQDSALSSIYEKKALASGKLPKKAKPYQPSGSFEGHRGKKYSTNIDPKSGSTTFSLGRSDQKLTVPRKELMKRTARGTMKDFLLSKFKDDGRLRNK